MAVLTDIGAILKQTVFDVNALSFTPVQEQAMQDNVIKSIQSAYVGLLGNAAAQEIATTQVEKEFSGVTYSGSVTATGFIAGDIAPSIIVDSITHTIGTGLLRLTKEAGIKAGIEAVLDRLKVVYDYVLYSYSPPLTAGDKGTIFLQIVGCSSVITKLNYTENAVAKNFTLSAVTLADKVTYTDSIGADTYVETAIARPLKVVGVTFSGAGAITFSAPVVATNSANVIAAINDAVSDNRGFVRAVTFTYVIADANGENSFVSCSVLGCSDPIESLQLLENDVNAFDFPLTIL